MFVSEFFFFSRKGKLTIPANRPHTPTMNRMLKTADPTMVPTPTSLSAIKTPVKQQQRKFRQLRQRIFRLWQRKFRRLKGTCLIPARPTDWLTLLYLNWVKCPSVADRTKKGNILNFRKTEYYIIVLRRQDNDSDIFSS